MYLGVPMHHLRCDRPCVKCVNDVDRGEWMHAAWLDFFTYIFSHDDFALSILPAAHGFRFQVRRHNQLWALGGDLGGHHHCGDLINPLLSHIRIGVVADENEQALELRLGCTRDLAGGIRHTP